MEKELSPDSRKRRNELLIIGIISVLIILLTPIEMKIPQLGGTIPLGNNIRRFFVAAGFITNSVEHWFKVQVEQSLQGSLEVVQTYYRDFANNAVSSAQQIGKHFPDLESFKGGKDLTLLKKELEAKRKEYKLSTLGIFVGGRGATVRGEDPSLKGIFFSPPKDLLEAGVSGKEVSRILPVGEGEVITGIAPIFNSSEKREVIGVVAASHFIPKSLPTRIGD